MKKHQLQKFYQNLRCLPSPVYDDGVIQGDALQLLERLPPRSIDLVLTDRPTHPVDNFAGTVRNRPALNIG